MGLRGNQKLGVSAGKHRYDIPLHKDSGARFLVGLIAVMTILMSVMLTTTIAIDTMTTGWVSGLGKTATIEIPAIDDQGKNLSSEQITTLATKAKTTGESLTGIQSAVIMDKKTLSDMIAPWLGEEILNDSAIPLPVLITVTLNEDANITQTITELKSAIKTISSTLRVDTHETWMEDLSRLVGGAQALTLIFTFITAAATIIIILMALRMRLNLYKSDIDLLHLMGASNHYIAKQFQRHSLILTFKGAVIGAVFVIITLAMCSLFLGDTDNAYGRTLFNFDKEIYIFLCAIPFLLAAIAKVATEQTVLRHLEKMP